MLAILIRELEDEDGLEEGSSLLGEICLVATTIEVGDSTYAERLSDWYEKTGRHAPETMKMIFEREYSEAMEWRRSRRSLR